MYGVVEFAIEIEYKVLIIIICIWCTCMDPDINCRSPRNAPNIELQWGRWGRDWT